MDVQERMDELLKIAEQGGIAVRREHLGGDGGGLCTLKGQRVLFVDLSADSQTRYEKTLAALAGLPHVRDVYLSPQVREDLEAARPIGAGPE